MADEDSSPLPFRRERNLSNRNFHKRGSNRRRISNESHSSAELKALNVTNSPVDNKTLDDNDASLTTPSLSLNATSSSMDICYSVNSDTKSMLKMSSIEINLNDGKNKDNTENGNSSQINPGSGKKPPTPETPDPALLDVRQKLLLFENLQVDERLILKTSKYKSKSSQSILETSSPSSSSSSSASSSTKSAAYLVKVYPTASANSQLDSANNSGLHASIDEERSEDEVDSLGEDISQGTHDDFGRAISLDERQIKENIISVAAINETFLTPVMQHSKKVHSKDKEKGKAEEAATTPTEAKSANIRSKKNKDFPRNFRSRPKTEVIEGSSEHGLSETNKFNSLHHKAKQSDVEDEEQIEMRDKSFSCVQPILEELIKTEESYVENLWIGINNYGNIFQRSDLPLGLRGKKYVLFGNIEQIAEFHRDEFLPMLQRNKHDLKRIFDEFKHFIDENCFYGYVLFTMNKQRSLKLCDLYKNYFKLLQNEIDDKLGINSFLVQPIQRMARYPLLLQQFITTLFKNRDYVFKPLIESCCRLEKKFRNLLITTNESEIINDIVCSCDDHEFNIFYQGKFRKVSEFQVTDHGAKRSFRSKVFIFDKCIIYTEVKGKQLIFRDRYPCEHIGILTKSKQFTLYYDQRKQKECDFIGDQSLIDQWLDLIRDMISAYAAEERRKLKELHSHEFGGDHLHRKPPNLSLFRDSNRFSTDSGIGNMWIVPRPEQEEPTSNRTTWYAGP